MEVEAIKPGQLNVTWHPPQEPNGNITHYKVIYSERTLDGNKLDLRNYCVDSKYYV